MSAGKSPAGTELLLTYAETISAASSMLLVEVIVSLIALSCSPLNTWTNWRAALDMPEFRRSEKWRPRIETIFTSEFSFGQVSDPKIFSGRQINIGNFLT